MKKNNILDGFGLQQGYIMVGIGCMMLFIPLIGYLTDWFTFGHDFGNYHGMLLR